MIRQKGTTVSMAQKHPGILELARLVAALTTGGATSAERERAVGLALDLYRIDEISRQKYREVARAAGPTRPDLDDTVRAVDEEPLGDG
ncbi:MAG: hypothetical protein RLZZ450_6117 [Pseudomonadota bacterium]|jgi:hypothetical protein